MEIQQAGWYPDPSGNATKLRYWDGAQWTNDYCEATQAAQPVPPIQPQVVMQETVYTDTSGQQVKVDQVYVQTPPYTGYYANDNNKQTLRLVAFILALLSTISVGWLILPLAWMLPMTIHTWGLYKGTKYNTIAFGVCALLFLNTISGVLLLVSGEDH